MKPEPTKKEYGQLRDLLVKYRDFKSEKYSWFSTDSLTFWIDEVEKNDLELEHSCLTSTQEWWRGLSRKEQLEIQEADGPDEYLPVKEDG